MKSIKHIKPRNPNTLSGLAVQKVTTGTDEANAFNARIDKVKNWLSLQKEQAPKGYKFVIREFLLSSIEESIAQNQNPKDRFNHND